MNLQSIMTVIFGLYLGAGLFLAYRFITKEIPEVFSEELDEEEDGELVRARYEFYDALHNLQKIVGNKGVSIILMLGGMLFWLPIWIFIKLK